MSQVVASILRRLAWADAAREVVEGIRAGWAWVLRRPGTSFTGGDWWLLHAMGHLDQMAAAWAGSEVEACRAAIWHRGMPTPGKGAMKVRMRVKAQLLGNLIEDMRPTPLLDSVVNRKSRFWGKKPSVIVPMPDWARNGITFTMPPVDTASTRRPESDASGASRT